MRRRDGKLRMEEGAINADELLDFSFISLRVSCQIGVDNTRLSPEYYLLNLIER